MAEDQNENVGGGSGPTGAGLRKPGCMLVAMPALLVLGVLVFGILGSFSPWILAPVILAIVAITALVYFVNKKSKPDL